MAIAFYFDPAGSSHIQDKQRIDQKTAVVAAAWGEAHAPSCRMRVSLFHEGPTVVQKLPCTTQVVSYRNFTKYENDREELGTASY